MQDQYHTFWCWAAVASSIAALRGSNCRQCDIANHQLNRDDCCQGPKYADGLKYDKPSKLSLALEFVECNRGVFNEKPDLKVVQEEIRQNNPVAVRIGWGDDSSGEDSKGGAHFVVIVGYRLSGKKVAIKDPLRADDSATPVDYDGFPGNYYDVPGEWKNIYYTKVGYRNCGA